MGDISNEDIELIQDTHTKTDPSAYGMVYEEALAKKLLDPTDEDIMIDPEGKVASLTKHWQERYDEAKDARKIMDNNNYSWLPTFPQLDKERLDTIEYLAKALSEQEIMEYFAIMPEHPLTAFETRVFHMAYLRGTAKGKREAMEKLFIAMGTRQGGAVALQYLQTHAERFPSDGESPVGPGGKSFKFTVNV